MSPIISFPTTLFTSSIIVLISFSISQVQVQCIDLSPNYSILKTACNDTELIDFNVCLHILQSTPKVASAKGLRNISIAIIESGISSSTNTITYIKHATHTQPGVKKGAFNDCKLAHDQVVERFSDALRGVKAYDYNFPSYLLLTASTDLIKLCDKALAERNVKDEVISRGNQVVAIFGLSAFSMVNQLYSQ